MKILEIFSDIQSAPVEIRLSRAQAPDTPPEVLRQLARDPFWFVRDRVAANPKAPLVCLQELMLDPDSRVRSEAERNLFKYITAGPKPSLESQINRASRKQIFSNTSPREKDYIK